MIFSKWRNSLFKVLNPASQSSYEHRGSFTFSLCIWSLCLVFLSKSSSLTNSFGLNTTMVVRFFPSYPDNMICSTNAQSSRMASLIGCGSILSLLVNTIMSLHLPVRIKPPVVWLILSRPPVSKKPYYWWFYPYW